MGCKGMGRDSFAQTPPSNLQSIIYDSIPDVAQTKEERRRQRKEYVEKIKKASCPTYQTASSDMIILLSCSWLASAADSWYRKGVPCPCHEVMLQ